MYLTKSVSHGASSLAQVVKFVQQQSVINLNLNILLETFFYLGALCTCPKGNIISHISHVMWSWTYELYLSYGWDLFYFQNWLHIKYSYWPRKQTQFLLWKWIRCRVWWIKKNIFLKAMCLFYLFIVKVYDSCSGSSASEDRSAIPSQPATSKPAQPKPEATASNILGLKQKQTMGRQAISLEMEVDQYLSNPNSGTSILDFWQVLILLTYIHMYDFTNLWCRNININILFGNGYNTNPGLKCCLWKGLLIWKGDNKTSKVTYLSSTDGSIADVEVFNLKRLKGLTFEILGYDLEKREELMEFERLAWSVPPGDAEAYGCNLEEEKGDSDNFSELDEERINTEVLGEQITAELDEDDRADDNEDIYILTNHQIFSNVK